MRLILGNCLEVLKTLDAASVQCVVTSPPYWGLRDYGTAKWEGGDPACTHMQRTNKRGGTSNRPGLEAQTYAYKDVCGKCGAIRVDDQLGLERTPEEYVAKLVDVFREVRRVLRDDGTLWLNLGDSYAGGSGCHVGGSDKQNSNGGATNSYIPNKTGNGLKPKDLIGIPWRVAFALQADGWWLRSDIIWHKPNPMPESVTDRPTKSHEYIFLLTKSARYYYDNDAIREPQAPASLERLKCGWNGDGMMGYPNGPQNHIKDYMGKTDEEIEALPGRNRRSVWTVATRSYKEAHFATYPPKLIEPCILAGTSERGACPACGAPWVRITERVSTGKRYATGKSETKNESGLVTAFSGYDDGSSCPVFKTVGWRSTCEHEAEPVACVVLDPFNGAGTTGLVALENGRDYIGIELNPEYIKLTEKRLANLQVKIV